MTTIDQKHIDLILAMRNHGLANYIIPGLDSHLIGGAGAGCVRLFQCSRNHREQITPHSHRFDFSALVLRGTVQNMIWDEDAQGDEFLVCKNIYRGSVGQYLPGEATIKRMAITDDGHYKPGDLYHMKAHEIHSINFSRDAMVLFLEGPQVSNSSVILQPHTEHGTVHTFKTESWMFQPITPATPEALDL